MQPIVIQDAISIAANSVNTNVIASNASLKTLQRLPFPAKISIAFVQSATGLSVDLDVGSANVVASSNGRVSASTPETPLDVINDDFYGYEGDMLTLKVANTTAGAITLRYMIVAEPMAEPGEMVQLPPNALVMVQGPIAVANGLVDFQLLDGLRYERPPSPVILDIFMTQSAAGMTRSVYVETERVAPPSAISLANRIPQDPFDVTVTGIEVEEGKEIQLSVTNNSGGALNAFWKTKMQQMVRK
jgi:hypothetical protein